MQIDGVLRAVQMLSADVANLTSNLALTRGQFESAQELRKEIDPTTWGEAGLDDLVKFVQLPIGQYQLVLRLLDALS